MRIVCAAAELEILDCSLTIRRKRDDVMNFEEAALSASSVAAFKRALSLIACPHRAPHGRGHVSRSRPSLVRLARV
jgi:hypothetical protein